jgi:hypothetical protein
MRALGSLVLALAAVSLLTASCGSDDSSNDDDEQSSAPGSAEQTTTADADPLVGEWVAVNRCEEFADAVADAGLEEFTVEMAGGLREVPAGKVDPTDPCEGAKPVEHSHSFSESGEFASYDDKGQQVDEGTYEVTDEGVFILRRPPFESEVRYEVDGDTATFDLVVPSCDSKECRTGAALGIATFFPHTYERVG